MSENKSKKIVGLVKTLEQENIPYTLKGDTITIPIEELLGDTAITGDVEINYVFGGYFDLYLNIGEGKIKRRIISLGDPETIVNTLKTQISKLQSTIRVLSELIPLLEEHGYELDTGDYMGLIILTRKEGRLREKVRVSLDDMSISLYVTYSREKQYNKELMLALLRHYITGRTKYTSAITVHSRSVTISINNIRPLDITRIAKFLSHVIQEANKQHDELMEQAKERVQKITPETAIALAMIDNFGFGNPATLTGRPKVTIYGIISNYLRRQHPDIYEKAKQYKKKWGDKSLIQQNIFLILTRLVEKGVITINKTGQVVVNNKTITQILTEIGVSTSQALVMDLALATELVKWGIITWNDIKKQGNISLETVSLWSIKPHEVDLDSILKYWGTLTDSTKQQYITRFSTASILQILLNPEIRKLVKDDILSIINTVRSPHLRTELLAKLYPQIITTKRQLELHTEISTVTIKEGDYHILVDELYGILPQSLKKFIVYRQPEKIAIKVISSTIEGAIKKVEQKYNEVIKLYKDLEKAGYVRQYRTDWGYIEYTPTIGVNIPNEIRVDNLHKFKLLLEQKEHHMVF